MKTIFVDINQIIEKIRGRRKQTKTNKGKTALNKSDRIEKLTTENGGGKQRKIFDPLAGSERFKKN